MSAFFISHNYPLPTTLTFVLRESIPKVAVRDSFGIVKASGGVGGCVVLAGGGATRGKAAIFSLLSFFFHDGATTQWKNGLNC